jgi:hypothetical protein
VGLNFCSKINTSFQVKESFGIIVPLSPIEETHEAQQNLNNDTFDISTYPGQIEMLPMLIGTGNFINQLQGKSKIHPVRLRRCSISEAFGRIHIRLSGMAP